MKPIVEISELLTAEICNSIDKLKSNVNLNYYNDIMGDTSFLLAGYLQQKLRADFQDWDKKKWIDDSLIKAIKFKSNKLLIWGVIIWGIENQTKQWTEPFFFELILNEDMTGINSSLLFFGDSNCTEITYEEFNKDRNFWDKAYYSNANWSPLEKNWKYVINNSWDNADSQSGTSIPKDHL